MDRRRSSRIAPLIKIARVKSEQGAQAVAFMSEKLADEQARLQQLEMCREEYIKEDKKQIDTAITLKMLQKFKGSLEEAIQQQRRQVEVVSGQLREVRESWRQLDARTKGLEKGRERLQSEEDRELSRLQQKEMDEITRSQRINHRP